MARVCHRVSVPGGGVALITVEQSGDPNAPCDFCVRTKTQAPKKHETLCDFPVHKGKDTKRYTCSKKMCGECGYPMGMRKDVITGELVKAFDLCPAHTVFVHTHGIEQKLVALLLEGTLTSHKVALDLVDGFMLSDVRNSALVAARKFMPKGLVDWHEFYTERAAMYEYESGMPRAEAERRARADAGPRPNPTPEKKR